MPACREPNPEFDEVLPSSTGPDPTGTTTGTVMPSTTATTSASVATMDATGATSWVEDSTGLEDSTGSTSGQPCRGDSCLVDRGVLVRYYIDDGGPGELPLMLHDSIEPPLELSMTYGPELQFIEEASGRGLDWSAPSLNSRASIPVDGSKIAIALQGSSTATIEMVLRVTDTDPLGSRISHIGTENERGRISLYAPTPGRIQFYWYGSVMLEEWDIGATLFERRVVHAVLDTTALAPEDRVRMFIDGQPVAPVMESPPEQGQGIDLAIGRHYVLGNREIGGRSFQGAMFYAALYETALSVEDIQGNAAVLSISDDAP